MFNYDYIRTQVEYKKSQLFFVPYKEKENFSLKQELTTLHTIFNLWYDKRETKNTWTRFFLGGCPKQAFWAIIFTHLIHFKGQNRLQRTLEEENLPHFKGILFIHEKRRKDFSYWQLEKEDFFTLNFFGNTYKLFLPPLLHPFHISPSYPSHLVRMKIECSKGEALGIINSYLGLESIILEGSCFKEGIFIIEKDPVKKYIIEKNLKLNNLDKKIIIFSGTPQAFLETAPFSNIDIWINPPIKKLPHFRVNKKNIRFITPT